TSIPPPPAPPPGPSTPPTFNQANTEQPKLNRDEQQGRAALLQNICKETKLKKVTNINDESAPILKPKASGSGYGSGVAALKPKGGLFQGGVPKLRPVGAKDTSENLAGKPALQVPSSPAAAPRPPVSTASGCPQDDTDSSRAWVPELPGMQRPSLPDLSPPSTTSSTGMMHASAPPAPLPPSMPCQCTPAPLPMRSSKAPAYNREKPLLPSDTWTKAHPGGEGPPAPPPVKPPPSPVNIRTGPSGQSLAPSPSPYLQPPGVPNGPSSPTNESAPELPQSHNSLHRKTPGPARGLAPPPPTSVIGHIPLPKTLPGDPPHPPPAIRNGAGDAPPPPPSYRMHGSATQSRREPPPPPRTPTGPPPPPPPPLRNGHRDSVTTVRSFWDDFESKCSFYPVDFPAPEEHKHFQRIYPSKTNRAARGPPLPPFLR
uniref:WH2 domain-containing protein n=1 Tax=Otolemur garnettii TaxID=30611 RepID=H0XKP0_OTOGA